MSTRATVYIHGSGDGEQTIKLYHHRDGYLSGLGADLEKALLKWSYHKNKMDILQNILKVGGFEMAWPLHGDVEYVYHIYRDVTNHRDEKKDERVRNHRYELTCQAGFGEESILQQDEYRISMNRDGKKKLIDVDVDNLELHKRRKRR